MLEGQTNIFEMLYSKYKIKKPIRLIEFFAGYGSQALALKYLGVDFEHWKICEWAIKSIQAYKDIHFTDSDVDLNPNRTKEEMINFLYQKGISSNYNNPMTKEQISRLNEKTLKQIIKNIAITNNLVNIQQVKASDLCIKDTEQFTYLLTYSFPCQDLSLAGLGKGMSDTSTRSGMLWEVERILTECKELGELPEILLMENVPMIHSVDNVEDFNKWQLRLEQLGYKNYCQDLIATDYGIPQTRNRTFMVSILGDYNYTFPKPIPLKLKLRDLLENDVDEKYFLSTKMIKGFLEYQGKIPKKEIFLKTIKSDDIAKTLTCGDNTRVTDNYIKISKETDNYIEWEQKGHLAVDCRAYKDDRVSGTIVTTPKNKILINNNNNKGYLEAEAGDGVDISSRMQHHRGTVQKEKTQTITTMGGENNGVVVNDLKIRKLTPKECFRLMGVNDSDYENVAKNQSNSSLYHLAGDSIVVNVLMAIFKEML